MWIKLIGFLLNFAVKEGFAGLVMEEGSEEGKQN